MSRQKIVAMGDPHGQWRPLLDAVDRHDPAAVLIVGDCDLEAPLRHVLRDLFASGIAVHYILGNHDCDRPEWYGNLVDDHPAGNFHCRVLDISGLRIAGLHGVYRGTVWYPQIGDELPDYMERSDLIRQTPQQSRWRKGLARKHLSTIFPEDHFALEEGGPVDVLVTHEAPAPNPVLRHGMAGIAMAAAACRARLVVHGHHHHSYEAVMQAPGGHEFRVRGLGRAEPWVIDMGER